MRYLSAVFLILVLATVGRAAENKEPICIQCHDSDMMKPEYRKIPAE